MDATFLSLIRGIEWDKLTAAEAVELRTALRDAVAKSEQWFAALSAGFQVDSGRRDGSTPSVATARTLHRKPSALAKPDGPEMDTPLEGAGQSPSKPKFRHRDRKVVEPKRRGRPAKPAVPEGHAKEDHPAVLVSADMYVSATGPDPDRSATLPIGHPRRAGGGFDPTGADPDFAAASRKMPEFN